MKLQLPRETRYVHLRTCITHAKRCDSYCNQTKALVNSQTDAKSVVAIQRRHPRSSSCLKPHDTSARRNCYRLGDCDAARVCVSEYLWRFGLIMRGSDAYSRISIFWPFSSRATFSIVPLLVTQPCIWNVFPFGQQNPEADHAHEDNCNTRFY